MKNLFLLLIILSVLSCTKETETSKSFEINGFVIEVEQNRLKFDSHESFYEVIGDYYENMDQYYSYFLENKPIENSIVNYEEFLDYFDTRKDWTTKEEVFEYMKNHVKGVKYENSQLEPLFNMNYKNIFCNLLGEVQISDKVYKYNNEGRYGLDIASYSKGINITQGDFEVLNASMKNDIIEVREDFVGGCIDGVGGRRITSKSCVELESFETNGCILPLAFNAEFISDAEIRFQRRTWLGWVRTRADRLRIDIEFSVSTSNGTTVLNLIDVRQNTNNNNVKWGSVDSYCNDCTQLYTWNDFEFDYEGQLGNTIYACQDDIFFNVVNEDLCP